MGLSLFSFLRFSWEFSPGFPLSVFLWNFPLDVPLDVLMNVPLDVPVNVPVDAPLFFALLCTGLLCIGLLM